MTFRDLHDLPRPSMTFRGLPWTATHGRMSSEPRAARGLPVVLPLLAVVPLACSCAPCLPGCASPARSCASCACPARRTPSFPFTGEQGPLLARYPLAPRGRLGRTQGEMRGDCFGGLGGLLTAPDWPLSASDGFGVLPGCLLSASDARLRRPQVAHDGKIEFWEAMGFLVLWVVYIAIVLLPKLKRYCKPLLGLVGPAITTPKAAASGRPTSSTHGMHEAFLCAWPSSSPAALLSPPPPHPVSAVHSAPLSTRPRPLCLLLALSPCATSLHCLADAHGDRIASEQRSLRCWDGGHAYFQPRPSARGHVQRRRRRAPPSRRLPHGHASLCRRVLFAASLARHRRYGGRHPP